MLSTGQDDWAHTNCALWSAEVFEEVDGTLQNVLAAIARGRQMVRPSAANQPARSGKMGFVETESMYEDVLVWKGE